MANKAEDILKRIPEELIYEKYLDGQRVSFNKHLLSPFRKEDIPSLSFIKSNNSGLILWRDWGDALQTSPEWVFSFVMRYYQCSFNEAIDRIEEDFMINERPSRILLSNRNIEEKTSIKKKISFNKKPFSLVDKKFWLSYGISIQTLIYYEVHAIEELFLNGSFIKQSTKSRPIYAFTIRHEGNIFYKIYDPLVNDKRFKWLFNGNQNALLGYDKLPKESDYVILTKSLKDVMSLYEYGFHAFSLQSENIIPNKEFYTELKQRFNNIVLFYDNDEAGKRNSSIISNAFRLNEIFVPDEYGAKDISDFIKSYGRTEGEKLMKRLTNNII